MQNFGDFTFDNALAELGRSVDALIITDQETDTYKALVLKGVFRKIISETGTYKDIVQKLWFHFYNSDKTITEDYLVFIPNLSKFVGKYSKRIKLVVDGVTHIIQMTIHPIKGTSYYLFVLDELDEDALCRILTEPKNSLIKQYTKLFKLDNIDFEVTDEAMREIAKKTIAQKTGARGLRAIVERILTKIMFDAPSDESIVSIKINADCVTDDAPPEIKRKPLDIAQ